VRFERLRAILARAIEETSRIRMALRRPLRSVKRHLYVLGRILLKTMLRRCPRVANGFVGSASVTSTTDAVWRLAGSVLPGWALTL